MAHLSISWWNLIKKPMSWCAKKTAMIKHAMGTFKHNWLQPTNGFVWKYGAPQLDGLSWIVSHYDILKHSLLVEGQSSRLRHTQIVQIVIGLTKNPEIYLHFHMKKLPFWEFIHYFQRRKKGVITLCWLHPVGSPIESPWIWWFNPHMCWSVTSIPVVPPIAIMLVIPVSSHWVPLKHQFLLVNSSANCRVFWHLLVHQQLRAFPVSGLPASPFTQAGSDNGNSQDVPGGVLFWSVPTGKIALVNGIIWDLYYIYINIFYMGYVYKYVSQMLHVWNIYLGCLFPWGEKS